MLELFQNTKIVITHTNNKNELMYTFLSTLSENLRNKEQIYFQKTKALKKEQTRNSISLLTLLELSTL